MPDRAWKAAERRAAKLIGGRRYWANSGQAIDCESESYTVQVKHVARASLAEIEALALEAERQGAQKTPPKIGLAIIQRRAGRGVATPTLVVMTARQFREMNGADALRSVAEPDA
jgi:hypothetical protein